MGKDLPDDVQQGDSSVTVVIASVLLILIECDYIAVSYILRQHSFHSALTQ